MINCSNKHQREDTSKRHQMFRLGLVSRLQPVLMKNRYYKWFNTAFLRDTNKLNEFKIAHRNRFQALQDLLKEEGTGDGPEKR
ncbi:unnamed protein product [Schistosoma mattheei]|uniref:Uncharacterized protein n=1 Tax=Schistosoma mattheei TaxID=31246 RepID=A0A183NVB9_9TREM|nr:unnamed protein product [Schistosoma mattheei]